MNGKTDQIAWKTSQKVLKEKKLSPLLSKMRQACLPFDLEALVKGGHSLTTTGFGLTMYGIAGLDDMDNFELIPGGNRVRWKEERLSFKDLEMTRGVCTKRNV